MSIDLPRWAAISKSALWIGATSIIASTVVFASAHGMREEAAAIRAMTAHADDRWDDNNSPGDWAPHYNYNLASLPTSGRMTDHQPWSDIFWPTNRAGIAARWNSRTRYNGFKYRLYSESEVRAMTLAQLAELSPAEKYDIFMGRFDYPTVAQVRRNTKPSAPYWAGICHGWAPAALNHAEPMPVVATSASGIAVPFGSGDVKGLLDQYYADNEHQNFLGEVCHSGGAGGIFHKIRGAFDKSGCDDVNAGALHVILANELGLRHRGFAADVDRWGEVWNQPVYGFRAQLLGESGPSRGSAAGTVREVTVHAEMLYADELGHAPNNGLPEDERWEPVVGTRYFNEGVEKYDYVLELDSAGDIIGGHWISANRPDFLWTKNKRQFTGYWAGINSIYRPVAAGAAPAPESTAPTK
jgi:hypothetical protein